VREREREREAGLCVCERESARDTFASWKTGSWLWRMEWLVNGIALSHSFHGIDKYLFLQPPHALINIRTHRERERERGEREREREREIISMPLWHLRRWNISRSRFSNRRCRRRTCLSRIACVEDGQVFERNWNSENGPSARTLRRDR
jgi:hypothetical protein